MERQAFCEEGTLCFRLPEGRFCIAWYCAWIRATRTICMQATKIQCDPHTT